MKKFFPALLIAALLLSTFSCVMHEGIDDIYPVEPKQTEVILRLKTPGGYSSARSRGLDFEAENTIDNIYVLVFGKDGNLKYIKKGEDVNSSAGSDNPEYSGTGSFSVLLVPSESDTDTYKLVVLANAEAIIAKTIGFDVAAITDKSYAEVTKKIWETIEGKMYEPGGTIPMWAETGNIVVKAANIQTLQLLRSVARIDVGVGTPSKEVVVVDSDYNDNWSWDGIGVDQQPIPFELTEVYVIRPNNRYAVVPEQSGNETILTVPAGTESFNPINSESKFRFTATASSASGGRGNFSSRDIYVPEADIKMIDVDDPNKNGKPGDDNHAERMAVVVGGKYNGSTTTTYYRLDFAREGELINVLRNHLYQFNISKVSGPGFPDVPTAYKSLSMNMEVNVLEWNEDNLLNVAFDGQYILKVSQDLYTFSREEKTAEETDNVLYVWTDYHIDPEVGDSEEEKKKKAGWYVEKIVDAENEETEVTWVKLTPENGNAKDKTKVVLTVKANTGEGASERSAIVWLAAGRLRFPIKVIQSNTPGLQIEVLDQNNKNVTELIFSARQTVEQSLRVNWLPRNANLNVAVSAMSGGGFPADLGAPATETLSGQDGTYTYTINHTLLSENQIETDIAAAGDPFLERLSRVDFSTTDGTSYVTARVFLRQIYYNLLTDVKPTYILNLSETDMKTETLHIRANGGWKITDVDDPHNILHTGVKEALESLTGGYNTGVGDVIHFKMALKGADDSKMGQTATIVFSSIEDGTKTWEITIRAVSGIYAGYFAGELEKNPDGSWSFPKALIVSSKNEEKQLWGNWSDETGTRQESENDYRIFWDGKANTLFLSAESGYSAMNNASNYCFKKNTDSGNINNKGDENYIWYLPANKQLMAIWAIHSSFNDTDKLSTTQTHVSSTENSGNSIFTTLFTTGSTTSEVGKNHYPFYLRCVCEF